MAKEEQIVHPMVKALYHGRIILHPVSFVIFISIFYKDSNYHLWAYSFLFSFIWPHIAFYISKSKNNPKKSEFNNFMFEAFYYGTLINIVSLSLWPSLAFIVGAFSTFILYGGFRFLLKCIIASLLGYLTCGLVIGFEFLMEATLLTTVISSTAILLNGLFISQIGFNGVMSQRKLKRELKAQKNQMEGLAGKLAKYLSPQVYGSIFSGEKDVKIETYRKKLSIFFSDIKDFTSITDSMESEGITSLLNTYFNEMSKIALKHGGTIDKFIGDAIMIFFGDPESKGVKNDALACVSMAIEMRERMKYLQNQWSEFGIAQPLQIRMGINTGFCTVGNFGSDDRMDYTIIGNQVNLTSRLESKADLNEILISQSTYALINDNIKCQIRKEVIVKGLPYPIQTYQVINSHKNLQTDEKQINENHYGFSLSVDLNETNREQAALWLRAALDKVELKQD